MSADEVSHPKKSALCAFELAAVSAPAATAPIEIAIEACRKAHTNTGALSEWGTAAAPTLGACLLVLKAVDDDPAAAVRLFEAVKAVLSGKAPVKNKSALLAVLLCQQPQTPRARKGCSRFACLVIAAHKAGTRPEQAAGYLETTTLSEAVAATRRSGNGARRVANPIRKAAHPKLWAALSSEDDAARAQANELIGEALARVERYLRELVAEKAEDAA